MPVAEWLNGQLWTTFKACAGFQVPRGLDGGTRGWDFLPPAPGREGLTLQEWVVRQPCKMGGLDMRSLAETAPIA